MKDGFVFVREYDLVSFSTANKEYNKLVFEGNRETLTKVCIVGLSVLSVACVEREE